MNKLFEKKEPKKAMKAEAAPKEAEKVVMPAEVKAENKPAFEKALGDVAVEKKSHDAILDEMPAKHRKFQTGKEI